MIKQTLFDCKYSSSSFKSRSKLSSKYSAASLSLSDFRIKQEKNIAKDRIFNGKYFY
jgi:hypothetical protein